MTLKQMGEEYIRQSEEIKKRIHYLRTTSAGLSAKQLYKLRGRILALYADAAALRTTGEHLINYYGDTNE